MDLHFGLITAHAGTDWHAGRLQAALGAVGTVEVLDPAQLRLLCGRANGRDLLMVLAAGRDAKRFDAIVLGRIAGPDADADLQLDAARALELVGIPCLNRVGPMLAAQDKLWTAAVLARAGIATPLCSSVPTVADALVASTEIGEGVAKPLFGSLGDGMFRCNDDRSRDALGKRTRDGAWLVQRFVPPGGVDYRLFVVGDKVEGCVRREAPAGEWRSNAAQGGTFVEANPHREWRTVAIEAARVLGLEVAGIDLAIGPDGPLVLEVNGVPNFRAMFDATGIDMAPLVAARAEALAKRASGAANPRTRMPARRHLRAVEVAGPRGGKLQAKGPRGKRRGGEGR